MEKVCQGLWELRNCWDWFLKQEIPLYGSKRLSHESLRSPRCAPFRFLLENPFASALDEDFILGGGFPLWVVIVWSEKPSEVSFLIWQMERHSQEGRSGCWCDMKTGLTVNGNEITLFFLVWSHTKKGFHGSTVRGETPLFWESSVKQKVLWDINKCMHTCGSCFSSRKIFAIITICLSTFKTIRMEKAELEGNTKVMIEVPEI